MGASARPFRIGVGLVAAALVLSGCSAAAPPAGTESPGPTPEVTAEVVITRDGPPIEGTSTGQPTTHTLPVPEGEFRSLSLDVECTGGSSYMIELGSQAAPYRTSRRGTCEGTTTFLLSFAWNSDDRLDTVFLAGVPWKITPHFSTAAFVSDPQIEADCTAFGPIYSAVFNADSGYTQYDAIDEAEWNERIDTAADDLETLAGSAESSLAATFAELLPALRSPDRVVGDLLPMIRETTNAISDVCQANETPHGIDAESGG